MSFEDEDKSSFNEFAKKAELAKNGTRFCVTSVREVERNDKKAWYLDILIPEGTEQLARTVTFDFAPPEKYPSHRDIKLQHLRDDDLQKEPVFHNMWIKQEKTRTGSTYYDPHKDKEAVCLCDLTAAADDDDGEAYDD